jgi:hypothetical protein
MDTRAARNKTDEEVLAQIDVMRRAAPCDLPALARGYNWAAQHPEPVLGWVMAQRHIDLATALAVFLRGAPERFNYMPKRDVSAAYVAEARLLDNICLRVNSGFYLPREGACAHDMPRLSCWIAAQAADRVEGASGRWVLDETILSAVMEPEVRAASPVMAPRKRATLSCVPAFLQGCFRRLPLRTAAQGE